MMGDGEKLIGLTLGLVFIIVFIAPSTDNPIWIYAVELSDSPPYTVLMIKFTRR